MYPHVHLNSEIQKALSIDTSNFKLLINTELTKQFLLEDFSGLPESKDIFSINGKMLPCWLESDNNLEDDWLTTKSYYPLYFHIVKTFSTNKSKLRVLEIGVRTGYFGVVCAKAVECSLLYVGVDPNIYVENGLELASKSFESIRSKKINYDYVLINGLSNDPHIQSSLACSGLFDIIHIDGNHTLKGKIIDIYFASKFIKTDGLILLDDYNFHSDIVQNAINRAFKLQWIKSIGYIATKRGLGVLRA